MDASFERRAQAVLMEAFDQAPEARVAFVEARCADDGPLRRRVLALVGAIEASEGFLETPALVRHADTFAGEHAGEPDVPAASPEPEPPAEDLPPGTPERIGGYRIVAVLGDGGMATVYRAVQPNPRRVVALKLMKRGLAGTSALRRFAFETEILARLRHPDIAQIHEAGVHVDASGVSLPFFVMELVEGARSITDHARAAGLSRRQRLELFAAACDAVQHGHQVGVIHRDLKPANLLVDREGRPRVIDFGVARSAPTEATARSEDDPPERAGGGPGVVGTLEFMSPEQCGSGPPVDVRTDVYALGVVLHELLCGVRPRRFSDTPLPEAMRAIREDLPPRLSAIDPGLRGDLEAIVSRAMAPDPDDRYPSAGALATDVRRWLRFESIEARRASLIDQSRLFARRNRAVVLAGMLVGVALIAATALSTRFGVEAAREARSREVAERTARRQAYDANIAAAVAAYESGEYRRLRSRLAAAPAEYRGWEWRLLDRLGASALAVLPTGDTLLRGMDMADDERTIATVGIEGRTRVWNIGTGARVAEAGGIDPAMAYAVAISADGEIIATAAADRTVRFAEAATGRPLAEYAAETGILSLAFSGDRLLVVADDAWRGVMLDPFTGAEVRELPAGDEGVQTVRFSRDRSQLLTAAGTTVDRRDPGDGRVLATWVADAPVTAMAAHAGTSLLAVGGSKGVLTLRRGDEPPVTLAAPISRVRSLDFSPDGALLAAGFDERMVLVWSTESLQPIATFHGHEESVATVRFIDDGSRLVSASWDGTVRTWDVRRPGEVTILTASPALQRRCVFSPDGRLVAAAGSDGMARLWDPLLAEPVASFPADGGSIYDVAFSPDGTLFAAGGVSRRVLVRRTDTGAVVADVRGHGSAAWQVVFSPDGERLAVASDDGVVRVHELVNPEVFMALTGHGVRVGSAAWSPDGRWLATGAQDGTLRLWDAATGECLAALEAHGLDLFAVCFDLTGERLFSGGRDQAVRVWSVADLLAGGSVPTRTFDDHGQFITSLAVHPDGTRLVGGSWFRDLLVWDIEADTLVAAFAAHDEAIRGVAFDASGLMLASASHDGTVRIRDAAPRADREREREEVQRMRRAAAAVIADVAGAFEAPVDPADLAAALDADPRVDDVLRPHVRIELLRRGWG